jgi:hypothetical protein
LQLYDLTVFQHPQVPVTFRATRKDAEVVACVRECSCEVVPDEAGAAEECDSFDFHPEKIHWLTGLRYLKWYPVPRQQQGLS